MLLALKSGFNARFDEGLVEKNMKFSGYYFRAAAAQVG
jgi:hypothetical protein